MSGYMSVIRSCPAIIILLFFVNITIATFIMRKLYVALNSHVLEAKLDIVSFKGRKIKSYKTAVKNYMYKIQKSNTGWNWILEQIRSDAQKTGHDEKTMFWMIFFLRIIAPVLMSIFAFVLNFPNVFLTCITYSFMLSFSFVIVKIMKQNNASQFQKYSFKIFRFLHNQISAGVPVTAAIKSVHQVVEKCNLQDNLVQLSGRYSLTGNLDKALDLFRNKYDNHNVENLCIAIKQGVMTGDNKDLLEKQEDLMFDQYINYIQSQTDFSRVKAMVAIVLMGVIVVIMLAIPMLKEAMDGASKIFVN